MAATYPCTRLHPLVLGWESGPESISLEGGGDRTLRLPVTGVLVQAPAGWVLLETGLNPDTCGRVYDEPAAVVDLPAALAAHDVRIDDLVLAAVSHLHVDHAGGLRHLAGRVPVAVQRAEREFAFSRAGLAQAYVREDYDVGVEWIELDGDAQLTPGIDVLFTPGHTPGHMSYRVELASGTWVFAVDAIDLQRGIDTDTPVGSSADPADAPLRRRSHDRLTALEGVRLVPGHCPDTWRALAREYR